MEIYKTYAEAKLANPNRQVWVRNGIFASDIDSHEHGDGPRWALVGPHAFLMSLRDFFDAGYVLSPGDVVISYTGLVENIESASWTNPTGTIDTWFVLSAACFGGKSHPDTCNSNEEPLCERLSMSAFGKGYRSLGRQERQAILNAIPEVLVNKGGF